MDLDFCFSKPSRDPLAIDFALPRDDYFWLTRPLPGRSSFSLEPECHMEHWGLKRHLSHGECHGDLIAAGHFGPDEIAAMTKAYEAALTDLRLVDRHNPLTELIARSILQDQFSL